MASAITAENMSVLDTVLNKATATAKSATSAILKCKVVEVAKIGLQELVLQQNFHDFKPLGGLSSMELGDEPDSPEWRYIAEPILPNDVSNGVAITSTVGKALFLGIAAIEFLSKSGVTILSTIATPLTYVTPVFGLVTTLTYGYQAYQECWVADRSVVPYRAKFLSAAIFTLIFASTVFSTAAFFIACLNPWTLPVGIGVAVICVGLAYLKHEAIMKQKEKIEMGQTIQNPLYQLRLSEIEPSYSRADP